jgi:hypothetical protein
MSHLASSRTHTPLAYCARYATKCMVVMCVPREPDMNPLGARPARRAGFRKSSGRDRDDQRTNGLDVMADEHRWKARQLTDAELDREIAEHRELLGQSLSPFQRDDVEAALRAFLLQRHQRRAARLAAAALRLAAGTVIMHPDAVAGLDAAAVRAAFPAWRIGGSAGHWFAFRAGMEAFYGPRSLLRCYLNAPDLHQLAARLSLQAYLDSLTPGELSHVWDAAMLPGPAVTEGKPVMPDQPGVDRARRERGEQAAAFLLTHFRPWMEPILQARLGAFRDRLRHDTPGTPLATGQGHSTPVACSCGETFTCPDDLDIHFAAVFIPDDFTGIDGRQHMETVTAGTGLPWYPASGQPPAAATATHQAERS